jgi:ComF family protein
MVYTRHAPEILNAAADALDRMLDPVLNLLFPETCFLCSAPIAKRKDRGVCPGCLDKARALKMRHPFCPSCGLPMHNFDPGSGFLCVDCILNPPPYSGARAFGFYSGELAALIRGLKFLKRRNLTAILAPLLVEAFHENWTEDAFDLVVPIPLHPKRRRARGYNQSELLARWLARETGIPFDGRILIRHRPTVAQVGLSDSRRRDNVRKAFRCTDPGNAAGCRILLIDDVMTTGATAVSASEALVKSGAVRVSVLALARTE